MEFADQQGFSENATDAWRANDESRRRQLREDGGRSLAENLSEGLALSEFPQIPAFVELEKRSSEVDLDGLMVKVCSLEDLLAMKRASERPRDLDDVEALEAAREGGDV